MTRTQIAKALRTTGEQAAIADDAAAQVVQLAAQADEQAQQAQADADAAGDAVMVAEVAATAAASRAELGATPPGKRELARFAKLSPDAQVAVHAVAMRLFEDNRELTLHAAWRNAMTEVAKVEAANAAVTDKPAAAEPKPAKAAKVGPTLRERADVTLPEGQISPEGYELVKVTGSFLQFARIADNGGPAWLTQCTAHSTTTGADNRKAGRNLGSSSARVAWCKGCKADAAKAAKAAAK
jgi:hypothetical protein